MFHFNPFYFMKRKPRRIDLTGHKFGKLTVLEVHSKSGDHRLKWLCQCDCGKQTVVFAFCLRNGNTTSCGCNLTTHGRCRTKEYRAWTHIKDRCYNPNDKGYKNYGARGIKLCATWLQSFENFFHDMGLAPSERHSIERIYVDGDYEPSNCKWATGIEQANNHRNNRIIEYNSRTQTLAQWCRELNLNYKTTHSRIAELKWPLERAFCAPE